MFLETLPLEEAPSLRIINLGASGSEDISEKHIEYLMGFEGEKPAWRKKLISSIT
jgi:hypothetical protein